MMKNSTKPSGLRFHARLLGGVTVLALASQIAFKDHYAQEHREIQKSAFLQRSREIEARWQALPYTNATQSGFSDVFSERIDWSSLKLSESQKDRLKTRVKELFSYLQNPNVEEYYRLKTEGLPYRFEPSKVVKREFTKARAANPPDPSQEEKELIRWLWNRLHTQGKHPSVPKITAACLDRISAATSQTNSSWSILKSKVGKGFTVADVAYEPGFRYLSLDKSASVPERESMFVHLSFFAKFNASDYAGPVHISFRWLEEDQAWALSRMITDTWSRVRTLF